MAERDIIQNSISQLGQSQGERAAAELSARFVDVDERTPEDLLRFARAFATFVNYHYHDAAQGKIAVEQGWAQFFARGGATPAELLAGADGGTPAQLALFLAFLHLYELPRAAANRFTERHLDFHYRRVLRFEPRAAAPDRAHVILELKKNAGPVRLLPEHQLSAGKDATRVELVYRPVREVVINGAKVDRLHTIFVDSAGRGTVRVAPVANSANGVGAPLPEADPRFAPFGHAGLPAGQIGFAVASPVLRMREGKRVVTLSLETAAAVPAGISDAALAGALEVFVTGEKGWLGPYTLGVARSGRRVELSFTMPETAGAVIDYDAAIHGHRFATTAPVVQIHLRPGSPGVGYADLADVVLSRAQVSVSVAGVTALALEGDAGRLDPKKPFQPFGAQPIAGSRFLVGCSEALSKRLTALSLHIEWLGLPPSFASHYADYGVPVTPERFTAGVTFTDGQGREQTRPAQRLFTGAGATTRLDVRGDAGEGAGRIPSRAEQIRALKEAGSVKASSAASDLETTNPVLSSNADRLPEAESGSISLTLDADFLHGTYRRKTIENALAQAKRQDGTPIVLQEPYTPTIRSLTLDYAARTADVNIASPDLADFASSDIQFFHVDAFGQRREHAWLRAHLAGAAQRSVPLLPPHPDEAELLVGVTGMGPGDSVNVLFQVAEGSADPEVAPPDVDWSALCDNHWKALGADGVVLDTTNRLLRSGLVGFVIPREATTENTLLPAGRVWLRAAVRRDAAATSRLLAVLAGAVEVELSDRGNDPAHLAAPLPARRIAKLKTPIASVKSVHQPYASFGGRPVESSPALITRASERLRHKDRCVTPWDYERVVLEAFPGVHKVKCVPHARADGAWLAPGHVLLVVVPDLRNDNARDPLQPRVDADTLTRIAAHVQARAGMQVTIGVKNPAFQRIRLDFKVRFFPGHEPNFHRSLLKRELTEFLSPWAFDAGRPIAFGGRVYRSVLLDFVEERPYVDYVTDFKMYSYTGGSPPFGPDLTEVQARAPDVILVSDAAHDVAVIAP